MSHGNAAYNPSIQVKLNLSPLGKKSSYISEYNKSLLFPIARKLKRDEINVPTNTLPFKGYDIWNAFELSWLNPKGKPVAALAQFIFSCESENIVESKSLKLYLNSFNNTSFASIDVVKDIIVKDLSEAVKSTVAVQIFAPHDFSLLQFANLDGECIDNLDIKCDTYVPNKNFLSIINEQYVEEQLYSNLLKSNCLVTGQPDWGSAAIFYCGQKIDRAGLLKYIVSFRNHNEFHEQCVERIFMDILTQCKPEKLTVYARYTRRGGLDINPIRSTENILIPKNIRTLRQ